MGLEEAKPIDMAEDWVRLKGADLGEEKQDRLLAVLGSVRKQIEESASDLVLLQDDYRELQEDHQQDHEIVERPKAYLKRAEHLCAPAWLISVLKGIIRGEGEDNASS